MTNDTPPEITYTGSMPLAVWLALHADQRFHRAARRVAIEPSYSKKGFPEREQPPEPPRRKRLQEKIQVAYYS